MKFLFIGNFPQDWKRDKFSHNVIMVSNDVIQYKNYVLTHIQKGISLFWMIGPNVVVDGEMIWPDGLVHHGRWNISEADHVNIIQNRVKEERPIHPKFNAQLEHCSNGFGITGPQVMRKTPRSGVFFCNYCITSCHPEYLKKSIEEWSLD
eukprot:TRINITY_DN11421_c0_g1_i1.p1 TRINITY_DN11421_c0_g1~~TRINITY_DN11421_c0_g1_i1.p1  ORF type:complete len:150 (+),score=20.08 TRINITY_DN11421_c0_g1_i1:396-845(+)